MYIPVVPLLLTFQKFIKIEGISLFEIECSLQQKYSHAMGIFFFFCKEKIFSENVSQYRVLQHSYHKNMENYICMQIFKLIVVSKYSTRIHP